MMKVNKKIFLFFILALTAIVMVACGDAKQTSEDDQGTGNDGGNAETKYKDTFTIAVNNDQDYMDGQMNVSNDKVMPLVYSFLVQRDIDGNIVGDLAESWEVSEDELVWTFKLKKGVKFHNGKNLTATDVKATYDRLLNEEDPVRYTQSMSFIDRAEIVDEYTIQLITLEPAGPMLPSLTLRANTILDADYIEEYGKDLGHSIESVNGTGPYKLIDWQRDEVLKFERHDDYFGGAENYFDGPAKTKYITMLVMPEASARSLAVESGQIDATDGIVPEEVKRLSEVKGLTVLSKPSHGTHLFQFNVGSSKMKDPRVRQAISYAIDRETLVSTLFGAIGEEPRDNVMPPQALGYENLGVIKQDQEKAKQLLKEAGYEEGLEISLMATAVYNQGVEMGEIVKAQLEEIGIKVNLDIIDRSTFTSSLNGLTVDQFKWDMFLMGAGFVTLDGDEGLKRRFETAADGKNSNNYGFYSNEETDELFKKAATTTDQDARAEYYRRAAEILYLEDPVGVYLNKRNSIAVLNDAVEGFDYSSTDYIPWTKIQVVDK